MNSLCEIDLSRGLAATLELRLQNSAAVFARSGMRIDANSASYGVRYKVWRSNRDKSLHLLSARARKPSSHCKASFGIWDRGPVVATVRFTAYGFHIAR